MGDGRRGRPVGFRLSESSKRAISESKRGQKHKQETKDKISNSLVVYFKGKNPLSEELTNMYCGFDTDPEVYEWVIDNEISLNSLDDVMTLKRLRNANRIELTVGSNIEFFSHQETPELIVLFKEECELRGIDPNVCYDSID